MEPDQEFREFAESLMSHGVKFMVVGGTPVPFISLEDLKANKLATGRHKDLGDFEAQQKLEEA